MYFVWTLAWLMHNAAVCLKGMWIKTSERMSEAAKRYQEFITGRLWDESYLLNGTKFDGVIDDVLIDAKSGYKNFVKNGRFKDWFKGKDDLIDQANRQLNAAEGGEAKVTMDNGGNIEISANTQLTIKVGQSKITLKSDGTVLINGKDFGVGMETATIVATNASHFNAGETKIDGGDVFIN